jgi:hypothetical protein
MEKTIDDLSSNDALLKIARELNELYVSKKEKLPYSINVINELHANENANSRILRGLLQYSHEGNYPIFQSFLELMSKSADCELPIIIRKPEFTNQENWIDLLIKEKKAYAIIIENKIWNAVDRNSQIERYIDYVHGLGIPQQKIFIIYLTCDGKKQISAISLTEKAKRFLGYSDKNAGRFICMNFKYDILPWLDELLRSNEIKKEPLLLSALIQYSDYLKTKCNVHHEDIEIENELGKKLMEQLQIQNIQELLQTQKDVNKLGNIVSSVVNNRIQSICENSILNPLENKGFHIITYKFRYDYFDLEIQIEGWGKCWWAMESDQQSLFSGIWRNPKMSVPKKYIAMVKKVYDHSDKGYIGWNWFNDYELDDDFWINLELNPTIFVNFIISEIERVKEATKGIKL